MKRYFVIVFLVFVSCKTKTAGGKDKITKLINNIIEADNRADIKTVLSLYDVNAVLMPPGKKAITGIKGIDSNYQALFSNSALNLSTKVDDIIVHTSDAVAYGINTGSVLIKKDLSTKKVNSKYMMLLKQNKKNEWKITRLIWNDN